MGGEEEDIAKANRILRDLVDRAPADCRESMVRDHPLHRAIAEAAD